MGLTIELVLVIVAVLLILSIGSTRFSNRLGVPALVLFLLIGMLAGSDGLGGIAFSDAWAAQAVGVVALVFILFSGGLDTDWRQIRPVLVPGLVLANLGVVLSAILVGGFAVLVLGFSPLTGLLLGSIVSSTDAAAVFAVLRTRGSHLRGNLEPLIELESGSNDPIAVFLTLGIIGVLTNPGASIISLVPSFLLQMTLGVLCGVGMGWLMASILNRARLQQEGLYPVFTIGLVALTYGATALVGGNGFLAVYLAGIVLGNRHFIHKRSIVRFHEGTAWLMQIVMFLTLGLLVFPSQLPPVAGSGLAVALFLAFVARPVSVLIALAWTPLTLADKLMVSWAGLRGAVPIVLATFPLLAGVPEAPVIFNVVFFAVLVSVLLQGTTIGWVARRLGVNVDRGQPLSELHNFVPDVRLTSRLREMHVPPGSALVGRSIIDLKLPRGALVVQIQRDDEAIVPSGATTLAAGDRLLLLATPEVMQQLQTLCAHNNAQLVSADGEQGELLPPPADGEQGVLRPAPANGVHDERPAAAAEQEQLSVAGGRR
ncbi:MAG: potassium/proton antiporter [Chloroflexota bacterium]